MSATEIATCQACGQEMRPTDYIERLRQDAERYRWLRQQGVSARTINAAYGTLYNDQLDLRIDAAMEKAPR